ncbi:MAG: insulinase family protein [Microthrixaceae bacterium]|nr:insulinase family protein [Microthrixaceae bacterium]
MSDPVPEAASSSVSVWVPAGSRDEPPAAAGAFHFLEHLLFRGTARRSAHEVNVAIDAVGGELNAFTAKESTAYFARVPADHTALALDLLAEIILDPAFDAHDVDAEREVILEELAMVNDVPDELASSLLDEALFPDHGLGWEVLGNAETLAAMALEDLAALHDGWYRRGGVVLAAAGAVDHDRLVEFASERFSRGCHDGPIRSAPGGSLRPRLVVERDCEQVQVGLAWRGVPVGDPDRWPLAVLLHVLGEGPSSRLYREARDERGLAYSIGTSCASYSDAGAVQLAYGATPRHLEELSEVVESQIESLLREGIREDELRAGIGYLQGSLVLSVEDVGARMSRLGHNLIAEGHVESVTDVFASLAAVTNDDVRRVAERVFGGARAEVAVGPID